MDTQTQAQTLVRDILAYVLAGRVDEEARITFAGWITDAVEAAVEAKATELSEAVGFAGTVDADIVRDRIARLLDTLGQLFRWVAEALPVVSAAYAAVEHPDQLAALAQAVGQYRVRLAAQPPANPPTADDQGRVREAAEQAANTPEVRP